MTLPRAVFLLLFFTSTQALACSCAPKSTAEYARNADEIYFATLDHATVVAAGKQSLKSIRGTFSIVSTLKGRSQAKTVTLRTATGNGACGVGMLVSTTYVIFKKQSDDWLHACGGSDLVGRFGMIARQDEEEVRAEVKAALSRSQPSTPPSH